MSSEFTDLTYLINHRVISDDLDFISVSVHTGYCSAACNLITLQYQCVVAQPSGQSDTLLHSCTHPQCVPTELLSCFSVSLAC